MNTENITKFSIPSNEKIYFLKSRPWYKEKHKKSTNKVLKNIATQTHKVSSPFEHFDIDINNCELFDVNINPIKLILGIRNCCHDNCEELLKNKWWKKSILDMLYLQMVYGDIILDVLIHKVLLLKQLK